MVNTELIYDHLLIKNIVDEYNSEIGNIIFAEEIRYGIEQSVIFVSSKIIAATYVEVTYQHQDSKIQYKFNATCENVIRVYGRLTNQYTDKLIEKFIIRKYSTWKILN
jgi:phosphoribosylanthranilate isomerase